MFWGLESGLGQFRCPGDSFKGFLNFQGWFAAVLGCLPILDGFHGLSMVRDSLGDALSWF